jgi:AcrR family transcriptional regulator
MKQERKIDRRIRRTRRQLHTALHALIQVRAYESISVSDIVAEADISRATFYLHYKDKDELLLHSLESLSQQWMDDLQTSENPTFEAIAQKVFDHVEAHRQLYQALQSNASASFVIQHQAEHLVDLITSSLIVAVPELAKSEAELSRVAYQLAGMLYGQILWWLQHDLQPSAATMAQQFHDMSMRGIQGMRD